MENFKFNLKFKNSMASGNFEGEGRAKDLGDAIEKLINESCENLSIDRQDVVELKIKKIQG